MMRAAALMLLLSGCATPGVAVLPAFPDCPGPIAIPAAPPRIRTPERIGRFAVALELAREAERARGDACAAAVEAMRRFIHH